MKLGSGETFPDPEEKSPYSQHCLFCVKNNSEFYSPFNDLAVIEVETGSWHYPLLSVVVGIQRTRVACGMVSTLSLSLGALKEEFFKYMYTPRALFGATKLAITFALGRERYFGR